LAQTGAARDTKGGRLLSKLPKRSHWLILTALLAVGWRWPWYNPPDTSTELSPLELSSSDRVLVLALHPDDETLACGGVIQQCLAMGLPVRVVFLTCGDNNELSFLVYRKHPVLLPRSVRRMGMIRHDEALAAARQLGLAETNLVFFGYPDFGTLRIWIEHWNRQPPLLERLTASRAVPYSMAFRPGAAFKGEEILEDLTALLRDFRPTKVFVSHPADRNPDHQALYLFTRVALWNLAGEVNPEIFPYLVHFERWPQPRGLHPEKTLIPPRALSEHVVWRSFRISPEAVAKKRAALRAHRSQFSYGRRYLLSFVRANELFGDFHSVNERRPGTPLPDTLVQDESLVGEPP